LKKESEWQKKTLLRIESMSTTCVRCWVALCVVQSAAALRPAARRSPARTRRPFGDFKLPSFENPFDDRPGATVGALQVALANRDMAATMVVARAADRFAGDRSRAALPNFVANVATELRRRSDSWLYAAATVERVDPGRVERGDHERAYNRLVDREAAKFDVERTPTAAELDATGGGVKGLCVVSLVFALEGDRAGDLAGAAASEAAMRDAVAAVAAAGAVRGGAELYNAEVLWTPSDAEEPLFAPEMVLSFPELLAL